jgi:FkbM family methyltransferase
MDLKTYFYLKMSCIFTNDNNVEIKLLDHPNSSYFADRDLHEVLFRRINTYLINNELIPKNKNIIDSGAWLGDNSIPWAKNISGYVYAIDPSPENISFIKSTCELNSIYNVIWIQCALSSQNEILSTDGNINHCTLLSNINGKTKVVSCSLDYLLEKNIIENIGYIHLDVEGMEYKVLQESSNVIDMYHPIITFEQHMNIDDYDTLATYLKQKEYKIFLIDEILHGNLYDCRNLLAFHKSICTEEIIKNINEHIGRIILIEDKR